MAIDRRRDGCGSCPRDIVSKRNVVWGVNVISKALLILIKWSLYLMVEYRSV